MLFKRALNYLAGSFFAIALFYGAFAFITKEPITLKELNYSYGTITEKGIIRVKATRGMVDAFYIKAGDSHEKLLYIKPFGKYQDIDSKLNVNDTVKVYSESYGNSEIRQLEKGGEVLLSLKVYNIKQTAVGIISLLGGFLVIGITVYQDRKILEKNKPNHEK